MPRSGPDHELGWVHWGRLADPCFSLRRYCANWLGWQLTWVKPQSGPGRLQECRTKQCASLLSQLDRLRDRSISEVSALATVGGDARPLVIFPPGPAFQCPRTRPRANLLPDEVRREVDIDVGAAIGHFRPKQDVRRVRGYPRKRICGRPPMGSLRLGSSD
jgi:hypothetical protein